MMRGMSIWELMKDEAKRGPITLLLNTLMTIIAATSLYVALREPNLPSLAGGAVAAQPPPTRSSFAIWLTVAVYLSVTAVGASATRMLYRTNAWAALLASLVLAVLSLFLTTWAAERLGLDTTASDAGRAFGNLTLYGILIIYLGVAGGMPLFDLGRTGRNNHKTAADDQNEALGIVGMLVLAVVFWGWIVRAGQTAALKAFL